MPDLPSPTCFALDMSNRSGYESIAALKHIGRRQRASVDQKRWRSERCRKRRSAVGDRKTSEFSEIWVVPKIRSAGELKQWRTKSCRRSKQWRSELSEKTKNCCWRSELSEKTTSCRRIRRSELTKFWAAGEDGKLTKIGNDGDQKRRRRSALPEKTKIWVTEKFWNAGGSMSCRRRRRFELPEFSELPEYLLLF